MPFANVKFMKCSRRAFNGYGDQTWPGGAHRARGNAQAVFWLRGVDMAKYVRRRRAYAALHFRR